MARKSNGSKPESKGGAGNKKAAAKGKAKK